MKRVFLRIVPLALHPRQPLEHAEMALAQPWLAHDLVPGSIRNGLHGLQRAAEITAV